MKTSTPARDFGELLGYAPGNVAVYSSDYDSADESIYPNRSAYRSYLDGIYMGYKWQCVEFTRRWMYLNHGYIFDDIAMAYDIFELRSVRDVNSQNRLPLQAFKNGVKHHPQVGSLLIWEEGGEFEETGHVAIVVEVHPDKIRLAEQNVGHQTWPQDQNWCRELKAKVTKDGDYWIECSYNDATILGWMTQTDQIEHAEPTTEINTDLFTIKSNYIADTGQAAKSWLNIANDDEAAYVDMMQGHKLTSNAEDQHSYFTISHTAQQAIEHATNELHGLFMHATDYVLQHPELLKKFNLPEVVLNKIRQSWDNRLNQLITSRFDFALTPAGLKVYEYNCDSASLSVRLVVALNIQPLNRGRGVTMKHYSAQSKESALQKMMPPNNIAIAQLSIEMGIGESTLYNWRKQAIDKGHLVPGDGKNAEQWSSANKFSVVLETASLNQAELAEYCRGKGLYVEQVSAWRNACIDANANVKEQEKAFSTETKKDKKQINQLEKELRRKDKALAETAALLVLRKKANAIWGEAEDE